MGKSKCLISAALCMGLLLSGCGSKEVVETEDAILVDAAQVGRDTLVLSNQFVGMVSPEESVYIIPLAQGTVTETFFEVGDKVQAGDVLFKIDDSGARLQLEQAQLTYTNAQQQADSVLTTQQESTNLQLEANYTSALQAYQNAQINYFKLKDSLEKAENAVEKVQKQINSLKGKDDPESVATREQLKLTLNGNPAGETEMERTGLKSLRDQASDAFASMTVQYEAAQRTLETLEATKALTQGAALEDTKEQLNTSLQMAKVAVDSAELALSYYQVTTPIAGEVISKNVTVNGMATSSSPAYIIAAEDTMTVAFQVSEAVRNTLHKDMKIVVERSGVEYDGVITEVGNAVNAQTGLFQIKAAVSASGEELPSGVSVKITSDTYTAANAIIIPYDAVYYETEGSYVYTVKGDHAVKTYVTTGIFDNERIEIVDGITEEDIIITSWSPRLIDGAQVDAKVAKAGAETARAENQGTEPEAAR